MSRQLLPTGLSRSVTLIDEFRRALASLMTTDELATLMEAVTRELGFRRYALIHHDDLSAEGSTLVDLKNYPAAITERLFGERRFRRDPVIRACLFADGAFLWSDLHKIIDLDRLDRNALEIGSLEGLNEGITIPYARLGEAMGSCTFADTKNPDGADRYLGVAQIIGIFAFQTARRLFGPVPASGPAFRLHPRPRECVVLAGRGYSNKQIARELSLTPRTVDGYLTEARELFDAHDRTELVIGAVLAGEVGLHELRRQPE